MRRARVRALGAGVVLGAVLPLVAACGVPTTDGATRIADDDLPAVLVEPPTTTPTTTTSTTTTTTIPCSASITSVSPNPARNQKQTNPNKNNNIVNGPLWVPVTVTISSNGHCPDLGLGYFPTPDSTQQWLSFGSATQVVLPSIANQPWIDGSHSLTLRLGQSGAQVGSSVNLTVV